MEMMSFVHLFESCNQDSCAVLAIVNDVFGQLKGIMPHLKSVYLRQDNAGCYHCALTLITARQVAELNDLCLSRMDFSDPQGGKGSCDRKEATIKSHMAVYLNSGHDIDTARQMQEAIESFGGVLRRASKALQSPVIDNQKVREMGRGELHQQHSVQEYGELTTLALVSSFLGESLMFPINKMYHLLFPAHSTAILK